MKRICLILAALLVLAMLLSVTGCGKPDNNTLVGIWEYADAENGIGAVYDLKDDGTGVYTINVGGQEVVYELKYEIEGDHLLVRYVNNEIFSEDDVFDSEFRFEGSDTLIIKDTTGEELAFVKK